MSQFRIPGRYAMASENVKSGESVEIRVFIYDGTQALPGLTINIAIERLLDNQFWNGSGWQGAYITVEMTELTPSNVHNDGVYAYTFATEAAPLERVYDWSVVHSISISRQLFHRGRIRTYDV